MKKFFIELHKGLGLLAGLFITILCLTGAIMIFQEDVRELAYSERYFRPEAAGRSPLPIAQIVEQVNNELGAEPIASVEISADTTRNYILAPAGKGKPKYYVDPYSGKIVGKTDPKNSDFFGYALKLHRWLLTSPDSWGKKVTGAATLMFAFILISGIVYWWPKSKKQLRARLSVKTDANRHRLMSDLHASLGIYCSVLLLVMALTGLTWSYPWYRSGLYAILGIETPPEAPKGDKKSEGKDKSQDAPEPFAWDAAYSAVASQHSDYKYIRLELGKASVGRPGNYGNVRAADNYKLDKQTGAIKSVERYEDAPEANKARGWIYSLHTGVVGGLFTRILYFVVCLMGASFPITGVWLYLRKRANAQKAEAKRQAKTNE